MSSVSIQGNASGTGIFTIASPNSNTNRTLTLPDNTGTILTGSSSITRSQLPAGSVLQVVSATKTDTSSTTGSSFSDVSGLSVSITPSSSSNKVLIFYNLALTNSGANTRFAGRLLRDSTAIGIADTAGSRTRATSGSQTASGPGNAEMWSAGVTYLDSPSTTSATTYKIQFAAIDGTTVYVNRGPTDTDTASVQRVVSSITVMEIAA